MQEVLSEKMKLRFASLLHDIGKFWQRTGERGSHEELSTRFVREYLPEKLQEVTFLAGHHDASKYMGEEYKLLKILVVADWLSSGERLLAERKEKVEEVPMLSIFSEVNLNGKEKVEDRYIVPSVYSVDNIAYPKKREEIKNLPSSYRAVWELFISDIKKANKENVENFFETLYHLLKKYTSFIPSAVYETIPDVSLFDHSKMTCAIAECLLRTTDLEYLDRLIKAFNKIFHEEELSEEEKDAVEEKMFLLIGGDISGIQKFIYSIISKRATKGLRGRSFYLELLTDIIAKYILKQLDLPITNLIYCAGGHFYILSPSNVDIKKLRKEISEKMFQIHKGKLYLAIDALRMAPQDFRGKYFSKKWEKLSELVGKRKKKKFEEIMDEIDFFKPVEAIEVCQICGSPIEKEEDLIKTEEEEEVITKCILCDEFEKLANKLGNKYLIEMETEKIEDGWNKPFSYFGYKLEFSSEIPETQNNIKVVYRLGDTDFIENMPYALGYKFYLTTSSKEFEELANNAEGLKRWAVLRGDVDNLGKIFSRGLGDRATISRISTLSSMLSFFFKGWINNICKEYKDNIYGIYSGGDDFFIVGSWSTLPHLAEKIYREFRKFTCENPSITLSVGISISPSKKYPLYKIAFVAGEELEKAKNIDKDKNAIAILGKAIKWYNFMDLKEFKEELHELMKNGIAKSFLQKLYVVYSIYRKKAEKHGTELAKYDDRYGRWRWILSYILARTKLNNEKKKIIKEMIKKNIHYLDVGVRWVEYLIRGEEK